MAQTELLIPLPQIPSDTRVCKPWLQGNCAFGNACRLSHTGRPDQALAGRKRSSLLAGGAITNLGNTRCVDPSCASGSGFQKVWSLASEQGHENGISAASLLDGMFCTGGRDRRIILWARDVGLGQGLGLRKSGEMGVDAEVTAMFFHEPSKWLFCGLADGQIRACRQDPPADSSLVGHSSQVTCIRVQDTVLLSGSLDGTICAWKYDDASRAFQRVASIQSPVGPVVALGVFLPGGIWACGERGISCMNVDTLQPVGAIETPARAVALLAYQDHVLTAFVNGTVKVFDGSGKETFSKDPSAEHTISAVAILRHPHAQKDVLLCGQEDGHITVYDLPAFTVRGALHTDFKGAITAIVDIGSDDGMFVTCGAAGEVAIWRFERDGLASAPSGVPASAPSQMTM